MTRMNLVESRLRIYGFGVSRMSGCTVPSFQNIWVNVQDGWGSKPSYAESMCWIQLEGPDWDTLWIMQMSVDLKYQAPVTL